MPMEDSRCLMRPTRPSLFLLCWMDMLQICTTTSHSSLAVRRLSLGPGSSLHVEARSWPSYRQETERANSTTTILQSFVLNPHGYPDVFLICSTMEKKISIMFFYNTIDFKVNVYISFCGCGLFCVATPNDFTAL